MIPVVEIDKLSPAAQRIFDPKTPGPVRQMAARGIAPGLKPADALTVVAVLSEQGSTFPDGEALSSAAKQTLAKLPLPLLQGALGPDLPPGVIDLIAPTYVNDAAMMERILGLSQISGETVAMIASRCNEMVAELVATNEERM
ncbi:MAG TPA: hypothetical protein VIA18_28920, partial [Polyangia bacterium]|nr:hypothetical protein [Polyangia bacterium]